MRPSWPVITSPATSTASPAALACQASVNQDVRARPRRQNSLHNAAVRAPTPTAGSAKLARCQNRSRASKGRRLRWIKKGGAAGKSGGPPPGTGKFYNAGMSVFALGLNHQTAPVDLRGRFAFPLEQVSPALKALVQQFGRADGAAAAGAPEVALLSTCNRTEVYVAVPAHKPSLVRPVADWLAAQGGVSGAQLLDHSYILENRDAARHVFRVAAGLDSMVLGEPQILGQMKQAVREADNAGTLGTTLHQLFQRSFSVAKEVRTSTEIGAHSITMAAANRTLERGEKLASRFGAQAMRLADMPQRLHEFDIVVSCTASTLPIIGLGAVERALKLRRRRPMFMVDLAVPRDIEPEVGQQRDVYLYTVDDLSDLVRSAGEKRQAAVEQAEAIIDAGVQGFSHWLDQRASVPLIQALTKQADDWRTAELQRARKALAKGDNVDA